jgi:hypothetical protein
VPADENAESVANPSSGTDSYALRQATPSAQAGEYWGL